MRRVFASAMLCLLLLLSVGVARCEAQCATAMPMSMQPASPDDSSMDAGMEHCSGMQHSNKAMPVAHAACDASQCHHQVLPAAADSRLDADAHMLQHVALSWIGRVVVTQHARPHGVAEQPLPQQTPLDQSSSLRV